MGEPKDLTVFKDDHGDQYYYHFYYDGRYYACSMHVDVLDDILGSEKRRELDEGIRMNGQANLKLELLGE